MLYILMEYCAGGDLAGVIQRCRKTNCILPEDVVWAYLTQITLALHDCHSETDAKGHKKPVILHRDIKPENGESILSASKTQRFLGAVLILDYSPPARSFSRRAE